MTAPLLSVRAVAALLDVPEATVYRLVATKQITVVREGPRRRIRFLLSDVDAWVQSHRVPAKDEKPASPRRVQADSLPGAEKYL